MNARQLRVVLRTSVCAAAFLPAVMAAAEKTSDQKVPDTPAVDLFDAIDAEQVEVKFIARSSKRARLLVTNKTDAPLNVRLPEAMAGVPVLGQFFDQQNNPFGNANGNDNNRSQAVGTNNNNRNDGLFNNNFFNIAPEQVRKIDMQAVCLEHGRPNPRSAIKYELRRIEDVAENPACAALLARWSRKSLDQRAVQAAIWHLNNGLSFKELHAKRIRHVFGVTEPYFSKRQLKTAQQLVDDAMSATKKTGESLTNR